MDSKSMTTKSRRFDLRTTPEVHDAIKAEAESQGVSVNVLIERVMAEHLAKPQVEDVRQGTVHAGAQSTVQPAVQDYGGQLDRMENNMDVLRRGMLAMAERQEASIAAMAAMVERQDRYEQGMLALAAGMQRLADSAVKQLPAKEPPALPEPKPRLRKLTPTDAAMRRRWGDAMVDDYYRRCGRP